MALPACRVQTILPSEIQDVRICGEPSEIINAVGIIADSNNLEFSYSTHSADYGKQITMRMIGDGFEYIIFNSNSESDFTVRLYRDRAGTIGSSDPERIFFRLIREFDENSSCTR
jgi:hypothetical protein